MSTRLADVYKPRDSWVGDWLNDELGDGPVREIRVGWQSFYNDRINAMAYVGGVQRPDGHVDDMKVYVSGVPEVLDVRDVTDVSTIMGMACHYAQLMVDEIREALGWSYHDLVYVPSNRGTTRRPRKHPTGNGLTQ